MKPHPRNSKSIKWAGAAATILLFGALVESVLAHVEWSAPSGLTVGLRRGGIVISNQPELIGHTSPGWQAVRTRRGVRWDAWWFEWISIQQLRQFVFPLWVPAAASLIITSIAWRRDILARRREPVNLCTNCDYDRTGLATDANCPECGTPHSINL